MTNMVFIYNFQITWQLGRDGQVNEPSKDVSN